jgi:hypothetical protein
MKTLEEKLIRIFELIHNGFSYAYKEAAQKVIELIKVSKNMELTESKIIKTAEAIESLEKVKSIIRLDRRHVCVMLGQKDVKEINLFINDAIDVLKNC